MRYTRLLAALGPICALILSGTGQIASARPAVQPPIMLDGPDGLDQDVSGRMSPMWQTNDQVTTLSVGDGIVYAGGRFTRVRPPGSAAGTNEVNRTYVAAFDAGSGALVTGFRVTLDGQVNDIELSADGSRLYIAGAFNTVNGAAKRRVAAVNPRTGAVIGSFTANADRPATSLEIDGDSLFVGGDFLTLNGTARTRLARVDASSGEVDGSFRTSLDRRPLALLAAPSQSRLLVGGSFTTVDGVQTGGMASLRLTDGALQTWQANSRQSIGLACAGRVVAIVSDGSNAFVTAEGDPPGCYEGTYSARITDGSLNWLNACLGAAQDLTLLAGVLYKASHQHDCAFGEGDAHGGFAGGTSRTTFERWHLVGQEAATGRFVHWSPDTNGSGPQPVGPRAIANDGAQIFVGGDFTKVDGADQQGLARYAADAGAAAPARPTRLAVRPTRAGTLTLSWPATYDRDSGTLDYQVYRDNRLVHTITGVTGFPWSRPMLRWDDSGRVAGQTYSYRVVASDGRSRSPSSNPVTGTASATTPGSYSSTVRALNPSVYWRLDDEGDSSGNGVTWRSHGSTAAMPGAVDGGSSVDLDGATGSIGSTSQITLGESFTQSVWFRSTSIRGGSILSLSASPDGAGRSDFALTMDNNGNLVWAMRQAPPPGSMRPARMILRLQQPIFNDGRWHHAVVTYDGATTTGTLYVDGIPLTSLTGPRETMAPMYLRSGFTDLSDLQTIFGINYYRLVWPLSWHYDGQVDEIAVFDRALTPAQIRGLYAAGVAGGA